MVEWGVSSKCHSAQAPVSLARVTSYNYNYNYNQPNCARVTPIAQKSISARVSLMCTWSKGSNGPM